jgi:hypothetical protein
MEITVGLLVGSHWLVGRCSSTSSRAITPQTRKSDATLSILTRSASTNTLGVQGYAQARLPTGGAICT